jgi:endonuclease-8
MPEGHTIHRLARQHTRDLGKRRVRATSPQGRFPEARRLDGRVLRRAEAVGKHLFHRYEGDLTVHVHLGLFGRFFRRRPPIPPPRETTRLRLRVRGLAIDLVGPMACELLTRANEKRLLARLGADPLRADADPNRVWDRLRRSRRSLGAALLDQGLIAGVGNVYRAEALFVNALHPGRPGRSLSRDEFDELWATLSRMLRAGVRQGRIVTVEPSELGVPRPRGAEALYVYRRRRCRRCGGRIASVALAGRPCYFCRRCQPPPRSTARP